MNNYVRYRSNVPSAYSLDDHHWRALEEGGWDVAWFEQRQHGALAMYATLQNASLEIAAASFEKLTTLSTTIPGCPYCGPPHHFQEFDKADQFIDSGPSVSYVCKWGEA